MISNRSDISKPGRTYYILLLGYMAFVVYGSLIPLKFHYLPLCTAWKLYWPTLTQFLAITSRSNFVANILLFIPLVFLGMGATTRENSSRFRGLIAVWVWIGAVIFGSGIEFLQLYFPDRQVAINDIIAQMIGSLMGIIGWCLLGNLVTSWARSLWREHTGEKTAVKLLIGYLVVFVVYQLFPFDLTISIHEIYHALKYRANFIPFTNRASLTAYRIVVNIAEYIPIGFLLALLVRHKRLSFLKTAGGGFLIAAGIEFLQIFVEGHCPSTTDVVLGTIGSMTGSFLATFFGPAARYPVIHSSLWKSLGLPVKFLATGIYIVLLGWSRWQPFDFQWPPNGLLPALWNNLHMPFFYQYRTRESLAAIQVFQEFTLFFFLGLLIASLIGKCRRRSILTVVVLAGILEGGQLFVPSRFFDLTTIAINITGGVFGVLFYPIFFRVLIASRTEEKA